MTIETELKFLVSGVDVTTLGQLVNDFADSPVNGKGAHLANTYYDTEQRLFRQADIGLRTRSTDGVWEQTIKTAGKVVGGLHQRPEFNFAIDNHQPNLSLFDSKVLPPDISVTALQAALIPLFTTNFNRHTWQVIKGGQAFEVVFDLGHIESEGQQDAICEVELELISGDAGVLFEFAAMMVEQFKPLSEPQPQDVSIRLGYQSKAARGYQLLAGKSLQPKNTLGHVTLNGRESLEQAFAKTVEYGLAFMQHHEQCFVDKPSLLALRRFSDGVALIRHGFWLFSSVISPSSSEFFRGELKWLLQSFGWVENSRQLDACKSKTGMYRKKLDLNKSLSQLVDEEVDKEPDAASIDAFFASPRYNLFLLNLTKWLLNNGWRYELNGDAFVAGVEDEPSLRVAATTSLNQSWQSLLQVMPKRQNLSIEDYISHHQQLKRSLLTGSCFASLYDVAERKDFRMPWIDLSQGIDELKTLHLLQDFVVKLNGQNVDEEGTAAISGWLEQQIESLLLAMEQSRKSAVRKPPYWAS
ncbi:MAG: triphosphatase [Phenylobacterium sp.]|jgi:triphosphatase